MIAWWRRFTGMPKPEWPHPYFCVEHGGSPFCEGLNMKHGLTWWPKRKESDERQTIRWCMP